MLVFSAVFPFFRAEKNGVNRTAKVTQIVGPMEKLPTNIPANKRYYSISEVAKIFDFSVPKVRYWEEFFALKIKRNGANDRAFTYKDLQHLQLIYQLVESKGYTLEGARNHLKNKEHKQPENAELLDKLQGLRTFLVHLREEMAAVQAEQEGRKAA